MKKRVISNLKLILAVVSSAGIMQGCYPGGAEDVADLVTVLTDHDESFGFSQKKTYYMPDTVSFFGSSNNFLNDLVLRHEHELIKEVEENMEARGYVRLDTTSVEAPDMFLGIDVIASSFSGVNWVPSYPGWGYYPSSWGWWGPGYGYGYPSYYPVGYSYDVGTVFINLADPNQVDPDTKRIKVVWFAALDGLLSSRDDITRNMVINGINQAFDQSSYLKSEE